jgi:hypothetical protein
LLGLYQDDLHVIVRGKAGAEVEFGNTLLLCEQKDGLILDWELFPDQAPADSKLPERSVRRLEAVLGETALAGVGLGTDRGFHSAANEPLVAGHQLYNAMCPRAIRSVWRNACRKTGSANSRDGVHRPRVESGSSGTTSSAD